MSESNDIAIFWRINVATATETPSLTVDIEVKLIHIPKDRRKTFDKIEERNQLFVDSIRRVGVLQPVNVRKVGDGYELVFGRRTLGGEVSRLPDDPVQDLYMVGLPARLDRARREQPAGHLTAAQQAEGDAGADAEFERAYGPDPARLPEASPAQSPGRETRRTTGSPRIPRSSRNHPTVWIKGQQLPTR